MKTLVNIALSLATLISLSCFASQSKFNETNEDMKEGHYKIGDIVGNAYVNYTVFDNWLGSWTIRGEYHLGIYAGNKVFEEDTGTYSTGEEYIRHRPVNVNSSDPVSTQPHILEVWRQRRADVQDNDLVRSVTLGEFAGALDSEGRFYADWEYATRPNAFRGAKYWKDRHFIDPIECKNTSDISLDFGVYRSGLGDYPYYGCQEDFDSRYTKNVILPAISQKGLGENGPRYTYSWTRYPTGMHWSTKIVGWEGYPSGGSWPVYAKDKLVLRKGKFRSDTFVVWAYGVGAGEKIYASSRYSDWYDYYDRPSVIFKDKLHWR